MRNILWLVIFFLAGCCAQPPDPPVNLGDPSTSSSTKAALAKDSRGKTIQLAARPQRILSIAPAATETLFALGAGNRVVAVTTFDHFPPEAGQLPKVGGFVSTTISIEAIVAQKPDLVFTAGSFQEAIIERLETLGIPTFSFEPTTIEETITLMNAIGTITGQIAQAEQLCSDFTDRVRGIRERATSRQQTGKTTTPKVLFLVATEPLLAAGPKTFLGEAIELVGGINILAGTNQQYPRINEELLLAQPPDVILGLEGEHAGTLRTISTRPGWQQIPAIKNNRIVSIHDDWIARPGPRLILGIEAVEQALFPKEPE